MFKKAWQTLVAWLQAWWHSVYFGALVLAAALSPSSYRATEGTPTLLARLYLQTAPVLPWFTALTALLSLVLIRIVVVTAQSYGLSQYAMEVVVRVLVMELLPLSATLFVAFRTMVPMSVQLRALKQSGQLEGWETGASPLVTQLVPRMLAAVFSVLTLVLVSGVAALVLAYLVLNGLSASGFASYTRLVGQVFLPAVAIGFALKTLLFAFAVAIIPMGAALEENVEAPVPGAAPPGMIRLLLAIMLIEAATLMLKYF
jgi:phospholipid/cholesterol/gamma-HCH transport system permease protein